MAFPRVATETERRGHKYPEPRAREPMASTRAWWQLRRVKHRDAIALCAVSAAFLLAGEFTAPIFGEVYAAHLAPFLDRPTEFVLRTVLAIFAFTTAFGAVLVLCGGWYFLQGRVPRGRFLLGVGLGFTGLTLASKLAYWTLAQGSPFPYLLGLASTLTGIGVLIGVAAHTLMGQYALLLKKRVRGVWRRWRRARRPYRS